MELNRPLATITPTIDGDVLALLAKTDSAFTLQQIHAVLSQFSKEGLRRALVRLARQGVVHTEKISRIYTYRLNREHLAAAAIIELADLQQTFLTRLMKRLSDWPIPPVYAAIFGSAARGMMTDASDLDLLLILGDDVERNEWDEQVATLMDDITKWTGNDARPVEYTVGELERARTEPVLSDVLNEGLTIAGNRSWLARRLRR